MRQHYAALPTQHGTADGERQRADEPDEGATQRHLPLWEPPAPVGGHERGDAEQERRERGHRPSASLGPDPRECRTLQ
jgi:hypothetical protein